MKIPASNVAHERAFTKVHLQITRRREVREQNTLVHGEKASLSYVRETADYQLHTYLAELNVHLSLSTSPGYRIVGVLISATK